MNKFLGFAAFSLFFAQASLALTFDDLKPVEYKFIEITAKYKNQPLLAYTVSEWSACIDESERGYGNVVGTFSIGCNVLTRFAQTRADKLCRKFGFDKAAKVNRLWLNSQNPYFNYSTEERAVEQKHLPPPVVASFDGDYRNTKPLSSFPTLLTLDDYDEFVQVDLIKMMSKRGLSGDRYSAQNLSRRTPKATVEAMGHTSGTFRIVICGARN